MIIPTPSISIPMPCFSPDGFSPGGTRRVGHDIDTTQGSACNALRMRGPQVYSRGCFVHFSWLCRPYSTELDEGGCSYLRSTFGSLHCHWMYGLIGSACSNGAFSHTLLQRSCCSASGLNHIIRIRLVNACMQIFFSCPKNTIWDLLHCCYNVLWYW